MKRVVPGGIPVMSLRLEILGTYIIRKYMVGHQAIGERFGMLLPLMKAIPGKSKESSLEQGKKIHSTPKPLLPPTFLNQEGNITSITLE